MLDHSKFVTYAIDLLDTIEEGLKYVELQFKKPKFSKAVLLLDSLIDAINNIEQNLAYTSMYLPQNDAAEYSKNLKGIINSLNQNNFNVNQQIHLDDLICSYLQWKREIERVLTPLDKVENTIDYDKKFEELLTKYNINTTINLELFYGAHEDTKKYIIERFSNIKSYERVAIWGNEEHNNKLIDLVQNHLQCNMYIISEDMTVMDTLTDKYKNILPSSILLESIDCIVISDYEQRFGIIEKVKTISSKIEIIDIYSVKIDNRWDFILQGPFYQSNFYGIQYVFDVLNLLNFYYKSSEEEEQEILLYNLIVKYLEYRDFVFAFKFINEYLDKNFSKSDIFREFSIELNKFLEDMKYQLQNRRTKDTIVLLIDSLRQDDVSRYHINGLNKPLSDSQHEKDNGQEEKKCMKYVSKLSEDGITFEKCFSFSVYTRASLIGMMEDEIQDLTEPFIRKQYEVDCKNSSFIKHLIEYDYRIENYSLVSFKPPEHYPFNKNISNIRVREPNASKYLWTYLCRLLKENMGLSVISFLHLMEIHKPTFGLYLSDKVIDSNLKIMNTVAATDSRHLEILEYMDKQLEFFLEMLPSSTIKVITADHGNEYGKSKKYKHHTQDVLPWHDEHTHIPLIIHNNSLRPVKHSQLFSMKHFGEQLLNIIKYGKVKHIQNDFIEVLRDPIYNIGHFNKKLSEIRPEFHKFLRAYIAVRGEFDKYVAYDDGLEEYYILPDEEANRIHENIHTMRIAKIKKHIKDNVFLQTYKRSI